MFEEMKISIKVKLAALWTSFMFLYIYVDYFHLYMPDKVTDILQGRVFEFNISQGFLLAALVSVTIPAIMISLSVLLPAKINRLTNIIVATIFIPYTLFNLVGEMPWMHMIFGATIEVILLCLIIHSAVKWPRQKKN